MNYFILPFMILTALVIIGLLVLIKFKIGRFFLKMIAAILCVPVAYLMVETALFYSVGRSLNPIVGIVLGMLWPPKSYSEHLVDMEIKDGVHRYEGEFICRHLGKYGVALYIEPSMLKKSLRPATMKCGLSYEIVSSDGSVCVSGAVDSKHGSYINIYSPYVIVGKFNVPDDIVPNLKYRLKVYINNSGDGLIEGFHHRSITVIKMSDA